jgi:hypothetical protein
MEPVRGSMGKNRAKCHDHSDRSRGQLTENKCGPGRIRTYDQRIMSPLL